LFRNAFRSLPPAIREPLRRLRKRLTFRGEVEPLFSLEQAMAWLAALREAGVSFGFPEELTAGRTAFAILKHDIHQNLDRAVAMALAEQANGIAGLYFMMGPHHLNQNYFGSRRSWKKLRRIQAAGHRIGLHLDVMDAILRRGDLYGDIAETHARFSHEGIALAYANSHGNTAFRSFGIVAGDFFVETAAKIHVSGVEGLDGERLNAHLGRYSLKTIGERYGMHYWIDSSVLRDGIKVAPTVYVSDNAGAIRIPARNISSGKFDIHDTFVAASVPALASKSSLILLHPQWYAAGANTAKKPEPDAAQFHPKIVTDVRDLKLDDAGEFLDLSVRKDGFRYDVRLNRRRTADYLIVALHGGVAGAKTLPVLARWKQDSYFRAPILSVFDPLIHEHPDIPAGWYVGDLARDATAGIAEIVRRVAAEMNIAADRVVFIGGSAGGFGSVKLACALGGGKFVSINGQSRIIDYYPSGFTPFSGVFDPAHTPQENAALHESRWSTPPMLEQAFAGGAPVRGIVIQNVNDTHHFEKHYTPFCARFGLPLEGGYSAGKRLRSVPYDGEPKHGAEPPAIARRIVREFIPELLA
jgi:hypothetical protein